MTAELMVELAGKPVHELLDVVAEQSGKASHQVDRLAFFDTKGRFYAWQHTCAVHGLTPMTAELMVELAGKPVHELLDVVAEQSGKASHQVDRLAFFDTKGRFYAQVIEATLDIVRAGAAAGLPMAVASGGSRAHVVQGLTETGILHYFQAVVCAEDVTNGKPAPDGFLLAAKKLGVAPEFCVGYEDAKLGMEAIAAAGFMAAVDVTVLPNYPHLV
ncbi:uncharacterized protein HaLaN_09426 [Haematococcus lacustris]|uniref:Beta-phosphoglucomutase n=1 Tax=Haematococcus lacustris TaxID=44745 RepID=A0A699Z2L2_HAELA|nr:uncharacterized protein HaLaN_09426 [Haematococcus lacustris]